MECSAFSTRAKSRTKKRARHVVPLRTDRALERGILAMEGDGAPNPVFLQLHILKDFKCCFLKLRILKGLRACFSELHILKELVNSESWIVSDGRKEKKVVGTPPVFCKRVRKALTSKELAKCSSLRSAEECEKTEVSFWLLLRERGREKQERNREAGTDPTVRPVCRGTDVLPSSSAIKNTPTITYSY
jgi:hypothetical protein